MGEHQYVRDLRLDGVLGLSVIQLFLERLLSHYVLLGDIVFVSEFEHVAHVCFDVI